MSPKSNCSAIDAIEKWALRNCNTNSAAERIVDERIKRVSLEIQDAWTEQDREKRCVYTTPAPQIHRMDCDRLISRQQERTTDESDEQE